MTTTLRKSKEEFILPIYIPNKRVKIITPKNKYIKYMIFQKGYQPIAYINCNDLTTNDYYKMEGTWLSHGEILKHPCLKYF